MERRDETTSSYSAQDAAAERGAGGKVRRQQPRKPPATPYARPPQQQNRRWLSKLVDPAYRFIAGGATRILPSFFSKSLVQGSLPPPITETEEKKLDGDVEQDAGSDDRPFTSTFEASRAAGNSSKSGAADIPKTVSDVDGDRHNVDAELTQYRLTDIEKLMQGKTFSRDEVSHLIAVINSRVVEHPNNVQESKDLRTPAAVVKGPTVAHQSLERSAEKEKEDFDKALWTPSAALLQSTTQDKIGASPVEIAKAFMRAQKSEISPISKSVMSKDDKPLLHGEDFALEPFIPSPSPKPSTCWPGAMLQDQHGYKTPLSQRRRYGIHNFLRTPYSRPVCPRSRSKQFVNEQGNGKSILNRSLTPLQQAQSPLYGQSRRNTVDDSQGSVGPIRRIRDRADAETPSRTSVYSGSLLSGPLREHIDVSKGLSSGVKRNLEPGSSSSSLILPSVDRTFKSSEVDAHAVHPHSRQIARTILEHLDRNLPTPKDTATELKIATSWKRDEFSGVATLMSEKNYGLPFMGSPNSNSLNQVDKKSDAQSRDAGENSPSVVPFESHTEAKDAVKETTSMHMKVSGPGIKFGDNAVPCVDFRRTSDSQFSSVNEDSKVVCNAAGSECPQKPPSDYPSGNKPILPYLSVSKPEQRWMSTSDSSSGFSFPVSSSFAVSSEPPTPSIMPSVSASGINQLEGATIPSYNFGSNSCSPRLVFSFPPASNTANHVDTSDMKFNFGSDRSKRISFSSVGKDTVCC